MKKLILIRHGQTDYTLQKKYCGHKDIPLNNKGRKEAYFLRLKLKNIKIDRVYSSDLSRALQTAKIIFKGRRISKKKGLREIDFGRFSGLTFKEVNSLYPDVYKRWMNDPTIVNIPGGESLKNFADRVLKTFKNIADKNTKKIVAIVSHGGPIKIIFLHLSKLGLDKFWDIEVGITDVKTVEFKEE